MWKLNQLFREKESGVLKAKSFGAFFEAPVVYWKSVGISVKGKMCQLLWVSDYWKWLGEIFRTKCLEKEFGT